MSNLGAFRGAKARRASIDAAPRKVADILESPPIKKASRGTVGPTGGVAATGAAAKSSAAAGGVRARPGRSLSSPKSPGNFRRGLDWAVSPEGVISGTHAAGVLLTTDDTRRGMRDRDRRRDGPPTSAGKDESDRPPSHRRTADTRDEGAAAVPVSASRPTTTGRRQSNTGGTGNRAGGIPKSGEKRGKRAGGSPAANLTDVERSLVQAHMAAVEAAVRGALASPPPLPSLPSHDASNRHIRARTPDAAASGNRTAAATTTARRRQDDYSSDSDSTSAEETAAKRRPTSPATRAAPPPAPMSESASSIGGSGRRTVPEVMSPPPSRRPPSPPLDAAGPIFSVDRVDVIDRLRGELEAAYEVITLLGGRVDEPGNGEKPPLSSPVDVDKRVLQLSERVASLESALANTQMLCDGEISRLAAQHKRELAIEKERQAYITRTAEEEMEALRASHQQAMHEMEKQISRAVDVSMGFQEELKLAQSQLSDMSEQRQQLQQELETARHQQGVPSPSSLTSAAAHIQAIEEAQALRARVQELEKTVVQRNEAISHLRNEATEKQMALLRDIETAKVQLEQQAAQFRAEIAAAQASKGADSALQTTRAELEASRARVAELVLTSKQQQSRIAELQHEITQVEDMSASHHTTQQHAMKEADASAAHWQKMFEESQAVNKALQRRVKEVEDQISVSMESEADQAELRRRVHDAEAEVAAVRRIAQMSTNQSDHLRAQLHQGQSRVSSPLLSSQVTGLRSAVQHASVAALRHVAATRASTTALKWVVSTEMGAMAELFGEAALSCAQLNRSLSAARSPVRSPRQPLNEQNIMQQQHLHQLQQQIQGLGEQLAASQRHTRNLLNTIDGIVTTLMKASPVPIPPALASIRSRIGQADASGLLNDVCSLLQTVMASVNAHHSAGIAAELSRLTAWKDSHLVSHRRLEIALEGKNKDVEALQGKIEELQKQLTTRDWQPSKSKSSPPKAVPVPVISAAPPSRLENSGIASFASVASASRSSPHRSPPVSARQTTPLSMADLTFAPATVPQVISRTDGSWRIAQGSQSLEKQTRANSPPRTTAPAVVMATPIKETGGKQDILSKASDVLQHARSVMREAGTPGLKSSVSSSLPTAYTAHLPAPAGKTSPSSNVLALRARLAKLLMHDTKAANMDAALLHQMAAEQHALQEEQTATYHQITYLQATQQAGQASGAGQHRDAPSTPPATAASQVMNTPSPVLQPIIHQAHRVVLVAQPAPVVPQAAPTTRPFAGSKPSPPAAAVPPSRPLDKDVITVGAAAVVSQSTATQPQQPSVRPSAAPPKARKSTSTPTPAGTGSTPGQQEDAPTPVPATPASLAPRPPPSSSSLGKESRTPTPTPPARPTSTKAVEPAATSVVAKSPVPPSRQASSSNKSVRFSPPLSPPLSSPPPITAEVEDTSDTGPAQSTNTKNVGEVQPASAPAPAPAPPAATRAVVTLGPPVREAAAPSVRTLSSGSSVSVRTVSASSTKVAIDVESRPAPSVPSSGLPPRPASKPAAAPSTHGASTKPHVKQQPSTDSVAARQRAYFKKLSSRNGDAPATLTLISPAVSPAVTPLVSHGSVPSIDSAFDDDMVVVQSTHMPVGAVRHTSNRQASLSLETAPPMMHGYEEEFAVDMQHEGDEDDRRTREGEEEEEGEDEYYNQDMHPAPQGEHGAHEGQSGGEYWDEGTPEEGETYDNGYQWYPHGPAPEGYGYEEGGEYDAYNAHDNNNGEGGAAEYGYYAPEEGGYDYGSGPHHFLPETDNQSQHHQQLQQEEEELLLRQQQQEEEAAAHQAAGSWVRAPRQGTVSDSAPRRAVPPPTSHRQAAISRRLGLSQFYTSAADYTAPPTGVVPSHFPNPASSLSAAPAVFQGPRRGKVASLLDLRSQRRVRTGQGDAGPPAAPGGESRGRLPSTGTPEVRGSQGGDGGEGGSDFDSDMVRVMTEETAVSTLESGTPDHRPRFVTDVSISAPDLPADAWEGEGEGERGGEAAPHARGGVRGEEGHTQHAGKPKRAAARSLTRKGASTRSVLLRGQ